MSDPQVVADIFTIACLWIFIYGVGSIIALIITSDWFLNTRLGKAITEAWDLISQAIQAVLPPYKR